MTKTIKNILDTLLTHDNTWQGKLLSQWHTIMGNLGTIVQLEKIEQDTLTLGVIDSCWMQELYLMAPLLIDTINQKLDQPRIKHLRFKKSGIKKSIKKPIPRAPVSFMPIALNMQEEQALKKISDPELSKVLREFLVRCHRER